MSIQIRMLGPEDGAVLDGAAPELFDHPIDSRWAAEFLRDSRHHLAVALEGVTVVGFASGVHYVHPDKPPELWINEVSVAPSHQRRGIGQQVLRAMLRHGAGLGCREAWVLTSPDNAAAVRLYQSLGGRQPDEPTVMFNFPLDEAP